jgi:hypothetical protein
MSADSFRKQPLQKPNKKSKPEPPIGEEALSAIRSNIENELSLYQSARAGKLPANEHLRAAGERLRASAEIFSMLKSTPRDSEPRHSSNEKSSAVSRTSDPTAGTIETVGAAKLPVSTEEQWTPNAKTTDVEIERPLDKELFDEPLDPVVARDLELGPGAATGTQLEVCACEEPQRTISLAPVHATVEIESEPPSTGELDAERDRVLRMLENPKVLSVREEEAAAVLKLTSTRAIRKRFTTKNKNLRLEPGGNPATVNADSLRKILGISSEKKTP